MSVDHQLYRAAMSRLPTGVTILSARGADRHELMTAGAVVSVSLEPTLLLASVGLDSHWLQAVRSSRRFAVNILAAQHEPLANRCADKARHDQPDRIDALGATVSPESGLLILEDALAVAECRVHTEYVAGDHALVIGEVEAVRINHTSSEPLVFFDRRFTTVPTEHDRMEPHSGSRLAARPPPAALRRRRRVIAPYQTRYQRWMKMWRAAG